MSAFKYSRGGARPCDVFAPLPGEMPWWFVRYAVCIHVRDQGAAASSLSACCMRICCVWCVEQGFLHDLHGKPELAKAIGGAS